MAHKGPADDGKRFRSDGRCIGIVLAKQGRGFGGGGGLKIGLDGRQSDDGKRSEAVDVVVALLLGENLIELGKGSGERGGLNSDRGGGNRITGSDF